MRAPVSQSSGYVANAFIQAQQRRNDADYKIDKEWKPVEVATNLAL
jgi:hypothetical protein